MFRRMIVRICRLVMSQNGPSKSVPATLISPQNRKPVSWIQLNRSALEVGSVRSLVRTRTLT